MKTRVPWPLFAWLAVASLTAQERYAGSADLDAAVQAVVDAKQIPGAVLLVGQGDRILHRKAYGQRALVPAREPMTVDTIFDIASLTKVIATTTAIMQLSEQGRLKIDDPVSLYLPSIKAQNVTIRQLLTHYSGFRPDLDLEPRWSGYATGVSRALAETPTAAPGEQFIYSDINFILLAELVRTITGQSMADYARLRVFEPLGMTETSYLPPAGWRSRIAPTEIPKGESLPLRGVVHDDTTRYMDGVAGHAGVFSSARDLSRFARMMLSGGVLGNVRIANPATVAHFTSPQSPRGKTDVRGLGWDIDSRYSSNRGTLFPIGSFGHTGFTGTSLWIDPSTKTYVILLANSVHPQRGFSMVPLRRQVATIAASHAGLHAEVLSTASDELVAEQAPGNVPPSTAPLVSAPKIVVQRAPEVRPPTSQPVAAVRNSPRPFVFPAPAIVAPPILAPPAVRVPPVPVAKPPAILSLPAPPPPPVAAPPTVPSRSSPAIVASRTSPASTPGNLVSVREQQPLPGGPQAKLTPPPSTNSVSANGKLPSSRQPGPGHVWTGLDVVVAEGFSLLRGERVGLITNQTGIDRNGRRNLDLMLAAGVNVTKLFSPEHGITGTADQENIADDHDPLSGIPIWSLYQGANRRPSEVAMADLDTLVFDIQDIGTRFYTYVCTMLYALEEAGKHNLRFIVLDRPNPIGGTHVEGPMLDPDLESFTGCYPLPLRHGMTVGEIARMANQERKFAAQLTVVPAQGWNRSDWFDSTGLPWVNPSPNIRSLSASALYPAVALLEYSRNYSVGRGTDRPFERIGAEWINGNELAAYLNARAIPGVRFRAETFLPDSPPLASKSLSGVRIEISDRNLLDSQRLGLEIAAALQRLYPDQIDWQVNERLIGSGTWIRLVQSGRSPDEISTALAASLSEFLGRRQRFLLY